MNDFKKGLLVGILLMSSVFLLMAQTKSENKRIEKGEIIDYKIVGLSMNSFQKNESDRYINESIKRGWQPFGSPIFRQIDPSRGAQFIQPIVKYKKEIR